MLPRKPIDIQNFLLGKIDKVRPYFIDFHGSIRQYKELPNAWLISSKITVNGNRVEIRELPPMMKYTSALKRIDNLFTEYEGRIRILNNSNQT